MSIKLVVNIPLLLLLGLWLSPVAFACESALTSINGSVAIAERLVLKAVEKGILSRQGVAQLEARPKDYLKTQSPTATSLPFVSALRKMVARMSDAEVQFFRAKLKGIARSLKEDAKTKLDAKARTRKIFVPEVMPELWPENQKIYETYSVASLNERPVFVRNYTSLSQSIFEIADPFNTEAVKLSKVGTKKHDGETAHVFSHDGKTYAASSDFRIFIDVESKIETSAPFLIDQAPHSANQRAWLTQAEDSPVVVRFTRRDQYSVHRANYTPVRVTVQIAPLLAGGHYAGAREIDLGYPARYAVAGKNSMLAAIVYFDDEEVSSVTMKFVDLAKNIILSEWKLATNQAQQTSAVPHLFQLGHTWHVAVPVAQENGVTLAVIDLDRGMVDFLDQLEFASISHLGSMKVGGQETLYAIAKGMEPSQQERMLLYSPGSKELNLIPCPCNTWTNPVEIEFDERPLLLWANTDNEGITVFDLDSKQSLLDSKELERFGPWADLSPVVYKDDLYVLGTRPWGAPKLIKLTGGRL